MINEHKDYETIEQLRAENQKLREALNVAREAIGKLFDEGPISEGRYLLYDKAIAVIDEARREK